MPKVKASCLYESSYSGSNNLLKLPVLILSIGLRYSSTSRFGSRFADGSMSKKMLLGTILPDYLSLKKKFLETESLAGLLFPELLLTRPSGSRPCSTQKSSHSAPPRLHPAPPTWIEMTSLYDLAFLIIDTCAYVLSTCSSSFSSSLCSSSLLS